MDKKTVVWLLGSNGSGKSTQCKKLVDSFYALNIDDEIRLVQKEKQIYTVYGNSGICVLGKPNKKGVPGLDSCYSSIGSDGISITLGEALKEKSVSIIVVDCILGTYTWYNKWVEAGLRDQFNLLTVHLDLSLWQNFIRIAKRRTLAGEANHWTEIELEDRVFEHVGSKNKETKVIFDKMMGNHPKNQTLLTDLGLRINALESEDKIHMKILTAINQLV